MDWTNIIVALITGLCAVFGQYLISQKKTRDDEIKDAQREQKQLDRLDSIDEKFKIVDKKLDEHNGYAEKFASVSTSIVEIKKDIEYLKKGEKS